MVFCVCPFYFNGVANASTWVPIGKIFVPVVQLNDVEAPVFNYGPDANITLDDFGVTSAIYYQTLQYQNGTYGAPSSWACHDLATLTANNNTLKLALKSGRYKVNVAAVMIEENCDIAAFEADDLVRSETYTYFSVVT